MLGRFRKLLSKTPEGEAAPADATPEAPPPEPVLDLLSFDEILTFRSTSVLPVLEDSEVTWESEPIVLRPRTRVEKEDGAYEYTAEVTASPEILALLKERYGPTALARGDREERRAVARIPHRIRVRSRHLPHFQAITHDITMQGMRLIAEGEVAPDTALDLDMQLDHDRLPNVKGQGVAVWSAPQEGRSWWVGVRITSLEDEATLEEYLGGVGGATDDGLTRKNFLD